MAQHETVAQWHIPESIHPLLHEGGITYLNSETGMWGVTSRRFGAVLLSACGVLDKLQLDWRELSQPEPQSTQILDGFRAAGLVLPGLGGSPPFSRVVPPEDIEFSETGVINVVRPLAKPRPPRTALEKLSEQQLERAVTLLHSEPFPKLINEVQALRGPQAVPASTQQTLEIAQAVSQVSDWYPGKFACLEHSTATAMVGAYTGLHIGLQFGASVDPIDYHAWPVAEGRAVTLPHEATVVGRYYPVFEI